MPSRPFVRAALCAAVLCTFPACSSTPEPDLAATVSAPKPKPPPKPKCEALEEKCQATPDTQARVARSDLVFIPPDGWVYAQQEDTTLTKPAEGNGALVMASFEVDKDQNKSRDAAYEKLAASGGISLPERFKKKFIPKWDKADDAKKSGDLDVKLWQADEAKREGKSGFLLVLLAVDPGGKQVMGVAFAPKDDQKAIEAIAKSLETLGPGSYQ